MRSKAGAARVRELVLERAQASIAQQAQFFTIF